MDLKKLIYFVTIVEEGQITRAANRLHIAQPPLSMQLKALEEELGVILINRDKKEFELTSPGATFYKRAKEVLDSIDGMVKEVKEEKEGIRGKLSIGTVKSCVPYLLPLLNKFKEKYPDVTFQIWEEDSKRLEELLLNKKIELGIVRLPLQSQDVKNVNSLSIYPLHSEPLVAIQLKDSGKCNADTITVKELKDSPLLILHSQGDIYIFHRFVETCKTYGFNPDIICESSDVFTLIKLAELGLGIAILPQGAVQLLQKESLSYFRVIPEIKTDTALIWIESKYLSKAALNFKKLATSVF